MRLLFLPVAAVLSAMPVAALATEATTTRIETRPFYGASVTFERGVRVFRPLPPTTKMIINPGGRTPVNLGFEENTFVSHNYNYGQAPVVAAEPSDGAFVGGI